MRIIILILSLLLAFPVTATPTNGCDKAKELYNNSKVLNDEYMHSRVVFCSKAPEPLDRIVNVIVELNTIENGFIKEHMWFLIGMFLDPETNTWNPVTDPKLIFIMDTEKEPEPKPQPKPNTYDL